jgi:uncharacterized protein Yka (UPF0111/DUF47 family)
MKSKGNLLVIGTVVVICLVVAQLAASIPGRGRTYEVEPVITTPEYKTDAARAIDAYERLMERYMDLAETHLIDCQAVTQRLDSIDAKIEDISKRLAGIEKAMGIDPNGTATSNPPKAPDAK